jgi:hypothetical protein
LKRKSVTATKQPLIAPSTKSLRPATARRAREANAKIYATVTMSAMLATRQEMEQNKERMVMMTMMMKKLNQLNKLNKLNQLNQLNQLKKFQQF